MRHGKPESSRKNACRKASRSVDACGIAITEYRALRDKAEELQSQRAWSTPTSKEPQPGHTLKVTGMHLEPYTGRGHFPHMRVRAQSL